MTFAKRILRKVGHVAKKRYFKGKGYSNPKLVQMAKDVSMLKGMINSEKKNYPIVVQSQAVGQVNINANGYYSADITPTPAQGTTSVTRNGNSIKLHSSFIKFQFSQMANTSNPIKLRIYIVLVKGIPSIIPTTFPTTMLEANPFVTGAGAIYDYNSSLNPDYFGTYKILRTKTLTLKADNAASFNSITNVSLPMKYFRGKGHHIRFASDGSQTIADGQLLMIVTADNGNVNAGTASTLSGQPTNGQAVTTGAYMDMNLNHYFYDN